MTRRSPSGPGRRRGRATTSFVIGSTAMLVLAASIVLAPSAAAAASPRPHRILIVSVPTLTWSDLDGGDAPNLSRFLDSAAIADLATRADRQPAKLGAAYVTIGAGTRAAGDDTTDGEGLAATERFGNGDAAAAYRQRTGAPARDGLVDLGIARIDGANANLLYEAHPGALGDELTSAGYGRSVVANGDGTQPDAASSAPPVYFRSAVGALMGSFGRVPRGTVGRQLLRDDASAPYGVRYDNRAVERAFLDGWTDRSVSVVEASDLVRADRYSSLANTAGNARLRRDAIRSTDHLFGRLLAHVDPSRDAVLVLAPVPPHRRPLGDHRRVAGAGRRSRVPAFGHDAPVRVRHARRRGAHRARSARHRDADHDGRSPHAGRHRPRRRSRSTRDARTRQRERASP